MMEEVGGRNSEKKDCDEEDRKKDPTQVRQIDVTSCASESEREEFTDPEARCNLAMKVKTEKMAWRWFWWRMQAR